jgi:hypothetical protein
MQLETEQRHLVNRAVAQARFFERQQLSVQAEQLRAEIAQERANRLYSGERPQTQTLISDCEDQAGPRLAQRDRCSQGAHRTLVAEFERFVHKGGKSDLGGGLLGRGDGSRDRG